MQQQSEQTNQVRPFVQQYTSDGASHKVISHGRHLRQSFMHRLVS